MEYLLDNGTVRPGDTLVDSSSGIYAYALALACHRYGLGCHIVGSVTVDEALRVQLEILGARLDRMEPTDDLALDQQRRVRRVRELVDTMPRYHWMRQYHDDVHYRGYAAVAERVTAELGIPPGGLTVVGGVGSGASTGSLATHLRRRDPAVTLVGVQPFGSVTFGSEHVRDPDILVAGIGSSIPFGNVRHDAYDAIHWIGFAAAVSGSVDLLRRYGVFAGLSSGAAYLAARAERARAPERTVLFLAADTGHRYVDSVFAGHREVSPVDALTPRCVDTVEELCLPWCRMDRDRPVRV